MAHKLEDLKVGYPFIYEGRMWMRLSDGPATCRGTPLEGEGKGTIHALPANEQVEMGIGYEDLKSVIDETHEKLLVDPSIDDTRDDKHQTMMRLLRISHAAEEMARLAERVSTSRKE